MKIKILILIIFFFAFIQLKAEENDDSTGVILRDNHVYILHKVEAGQGLFAVARRYNVHWTSIRDANPGADKNLYPGKVLYVPTGKTETQFWGKKKPIYSKNNNEYAKPKEKIKPEKDKKPDNDESYSSKKVSFTIFYTVKKGETLFSIAEKFNTTAEFLKQLNGLKTEKVKEGTDILVPYSEENKEKTKEKTEPDKKTTIVENNDKEKDIEKNKENIDKDKDEILIEKKEETKKVEKEIDDISKKIEEEKQKNEVEEKEKKETKNDNTNITEIIKEADKNQNKETNNDEETNKNDNLKTPWQYKIEVETYPEYDIEKVTETGQGKVMDDKTIDQTKDWVIHHNAAENTIILITNPANNKTVYAKVVKNFNRTSDNQVMIYLTKNTADFLELSKKDKFNIKLSFAK